VRVRFVCRPFELGDSEAVVLLATKSTLGDLTWLRTSGFAHEIQRLARNGRMVVGLCGGFQMVGEEVVDDFGVESPGGRVTGGERTWNKGRQ